MKHWFNVHVEKYEILFFFWLDYLSFGFNLMKPKANFEKCKQRSTKKYNKKHNFGKEDNS